MSLDSRIVIHSNDKTLPPDVQYKNNKELLNDMLDEMQDKLGQDWLFATLSTKKGKIRIR